MPLYPARSSPEVNHTGLPSWIFPPGSLAKFMDLALRLSSINPAISCEELGLLMLFPV
jgi:hypothetical protein